MILAEHENCSIINGEHIVVKSELNILFLLIRIFRLITCPFFKQFKNLSDAFYSLYTLSIIYGVMKSPNGYFASSGYIIL